MSQFDSIFVNSLSLRPAPFVGTAYEYNMSGQYVIGGLLIVTLSGTLVAEDINAKIAELNSLQANTDCVSLKIGCSGGSDFLDGSGRIRTITFSQTDQPYTVSYSMIIAIETIGGLPAVEADPDFISDNCLSQDGQKVNFLRNYTEKLSFQGEGSAISSYDSGLGVSSSYVKISGEINISSYGRTICGIPSYNPTKNAEDILKRRAQSLLSLDSCNSNILSKYNGWNKWLDTKKLTINIDGSLTWSFDMYLSQGGKSPYAWIDLNSEGKKDHRTKKKNKTLSGKIKGLSSASVEDYLSNKHDTNERISNANRGYNALSTYIINGTWPESDVVLTGNEPENPSKSKPICFQRLSSNIRKSVVEGEISFSSEFGDIDSCQSKGVGTIDVTIDETLSAIRYQEFIIPNFKKAIVQQIAPSTPERISISGRGTLDGCDTENMKTLSDCVDKEVNRVLNKLPNKRKLILLSESKSFGSFTYSIKKDFILCDSGSISDNCSTNTKPKYK